MSDSKNANAKNTIDSKRNILTIGLLFVFITFDIICDNIILNSFNSETLYIEISLFVGLLFLQILASPIQAGLSDFYGRKKGLVVTLSASFLSLVFLFLYSSTLFPYFIILCIVNLIKGLFGNTIPIIWSAIGDTESKNERFFFAIAESAYAVGYLLLLLMDEAAHMNIYLVSLILVSILIIYSCIKKFRDNKDEECKGGVSIREHLIKEPRLVIKDLKDKILRSLFLAFTLWEISLYSILILYTDFRTKDVPYVAIFMMVGYILGSAALKFCERVKDTTLIKYGYIISIFSLMPYIVLAAFNIKVSYLLIAGYFFHAVGNAILCPTLLCLTSERSEPHQRGKRFGILDSCDTLAFLLASIIIIIYKKFDLDLFYMVIWSFVTMLFSWIPYRKFKKLTTG